MGSKVYEKGICEAVVAMLGCLMRVGFLCDDGVKW